MSQEINVNSISEIISYNERIDHRFKFKRKIKFLGRIIRESGYYKYNENYGILPKNDISSEWYESNYNIIMRRPRIKIWTISNHLYEYNFIDDAQMNNFINYIKNFPLHWMDLDHEYNTFIKNND